MSGGVTVADPATTWVGAAVEIGQDTILHPGVTLEGRTRIGCGCTIRSGVRLADVEVGDRTAILDHTVATSSVIGPDCVVGPFAHLRPGTVLAEQCKLGNFVETKKTTFGPGTKASHLSYLGDTTLGRGVNIGAGTITCNYDGRTKNPTVLEDGVFIGSDTQLVAPVTVGKGAYVAAGSTIIKDVPAGALGISRAEQKNVEGWVERRKNKK
jgi:bifunctional UDP-N-acetylglucosamine pyrophosphorylase/glucosamine-1-phosphate N-acetyltransferase